MAIPAEWVWGTPGTGKTHTIATENKNAMWLTGAVCRPFKRYAGETTMVIDHFTAPNECTPRVQWFIRQVLFRQVESRINKLVIISFHPIEDCLPATLFQYFTVRHFTKVHKEPPSSVELTQDECCMV
jgi:hypothetical protein